MTTWLAGLRLGWEGAGEWLTKPAAEPEDEDGGEEGREEAASPAATQTQSTLPGMELGPARPPSSLPSPLRVHRGTLFLNTLFLFSRGLSTDWRCHSAGAGSASQY